MQAVVYSRRVVQGARILHLLWICLWTVGTAMACDPALLPAAHAQNWESSNPWLTAANTRIVRVREAGIVVIPWANLADTGWNLAQIDPSRVQIWRQGVQIPSQVDASGLRFFAEPNMSRFSAEAAYWVVLGSEQGMRRIVGSVSQPLYWEIDQLYQSLLPTVRGDHWFAGEVRTEGSPLEAHMNLPHPLPAESQLVIALAPLDLRNGHVLQLWDGNRLVATTAWDDQTSGPRMVQMTTNIELSTGEHMLHILLASPGTDLVLIDSLTIPEMRVVLPTLTAALEYPQPAPMITPADQLIISHPDFIPALAPLVVYKQQQGQQITVADVLAIYDTYSWGERDPEAIRAYIEQTRRQGDTEAEIQTRRHGGKETRSTAQLDTQWPATSDSPCLPISQSPCLRSVLLVGSGTTRLRFGLGEADTIRIPPYLIASDPVYGEIACDICYVSEGDRTLSGTQSVGQEQTRWSATGDSPGLPVSQSPSLRASRSPGLAIGRLPARTVAEAEVLVAKTLAALHPVPGAWQQRAILVADNDRELDGAADPAGPFAPLVHQLAANLSGMQAESLIYTPDQPMSRYQEAPVLRNRLFAAWDAGAGLVAYVGHASAWQWAFTGPQEPVPYLVARGDAVRANREKLPILLSLTCLSGSFQNPTLTTIDEELLRQPDGGIAASFSPTGSGVNTGHAALMQGMLPALVQGETIGSAQIAGIRQLVASHADLQLAFSYGILGDPDVRLPGAIRNGWRVTLPLVVKG